MRATMSATCSIPPRVLIADDQADLLEPPDLKVA
jgi:hypothetical protein